MREAYLFMVSELTRKIILLVSAVLVLLVACMAILYFSNILNSPHPSEIAENWGCQYPNLCLNYVKSDNNEWVFSEALVWDDETIDISIGFGKGVYCVYPADSSSYIDRLFCGTWKYKRGNLVLKIEEDFIFNNQYSEIILFPITTEEQFKKL